MRGDGLGGEGGEVAVGGLEKMVLRIVERVGTVAMRIGWAENAEHGRASGGGDVERTAVVANDQSGESDQVGDFG